MRANLKRNERGSVLLVGMVALVVMMLLGATAIRATMMQERLAGGFAEQYQAFQAAEMALRAGERLLTAGTVPASCFHAPGNAPDPDDLATWNGGGVCDIGAYYRTENYGAASPKFYVEQQKAPGEGLSLEAGTKEQEISIYKVTAQGSGGVKGRDGNPVIRVILQSSIAE